MGKDSNTRLVPLISAMHVLSLIKLSIKLNPLKYVCQHVFSGS